MGVDTLSKELRKLKTRAGDNKNHLIHAILASILIVPINIDAQARSNYQEGQIGRASWYGPGFQGKKTASGQWFNQDQFTAAHRSLPLGTKAKVTNLQNGKEVEVTINDRGPFVRGRIIDLSRAAARQLTMNGTTKVSVTTMP